MSEVAPPRSSWAVAVEPVGSPDAVALLREYYTEVADRYFMLHEGRRSTPREIAEGLAEYPSADLLPPRGVLLVARHGGEAAGCAGVRLLDGRTAELKQMFVRAGRRGRGGAGRLLEAAEAAAVRLGAGRIRLDTRRDLVEAAAVRLGAGRIRLDTRRDLVEAVALYRRHGFAEIAPYHDDPYAEIFFEKGWERGPLSG